MCGRQMGYSSSAIHSFRSSATYQVLIYVSSQEMIPEKTTVFFNWIFYPLLHVQHSCSSAKSLGSVLPSFFFSFLFLR